jgi:hypothetical protein
LPGFLRCATPRPKTGRKKKWGRSGRNDRFDMGGALPRWGVAVVRAYGRNDTAYDGRTLLKAGAAALRPYGEEG